MSVAMSMAMAMARLWCSADELPFAFIDMYVCGV